MYHITLICGLALSSWCVTLAVEPTVLTKTFGPTDTLFPNPERGWITHRFSHDLWGLGNLRNSEEKVSLVLIKIDISKYVKSTHIGPEKLTEIRTALDTCRSHGLKVTMRSAYAWDEILAPDPKEIQTIKNHVMDMKSIYNQYADIIIAVEMGMFGPWGEMHSSQHSTINTKLYYPIKTSELQHVHNVYMGALPTTHSVLVRTPHYIRQIFNDEKPPTLDEAYGVSGKARTGFHNDAYLNSIDDAGTFSYGWSRSQELNYINKLTRYTFFGGESFGTPNNTYNNAKNALLESKQQHMTYLNRDYYKPIYDAWGKSAKEEFTRKLGYRFVLKSLSYSQEVAPGGTLNFSLKLQNIGFAAMHLNRPVNLILDNGKTGVGNVKYQTTISVDPRTWTPETDTISIDRRLRIPANIIEGTWRLLLALPDASPRLQSDGRYAVRFANEAVWNDEGNNLLIERIPITASAPGSRTQDKEFQEITTDDGLKISQLIAVRTSTSLILSATYDADYPFHQVFIDADNNPATGFLVEGIGADYLVENSGYFEHQGTQDSVWLWQQLNGAMVPSINGRQYVWQLTLFNLKLSIMPSSRVLFAGSKGDKASYSTPISVTINK